MSVSIEVGDSCHEIGSASFLHCFFSTVSANLERNGWGSRFPALMHHLYPGKLPAKSISQARSELATVQQELAAYPPSAVVWDIEDRSKRPPWGDNIAPEIKNLANYFVASDGQNLFKVLFAVLDEASQSGQAVIVR